jgi:predicted nucleic acid-binding protein
VIAFDTNILLYAMDVYDKERHPIASRLLEQAIAEVRLFLPMQVLGEFCHVAVRKFRQAPGDVRGVVEDWGAVAKVERYGLRDILEALRVHEDHKIPFWDALVWAVCERAGVDMLLSEDFQNRRRLGRVIVLDPFNPQNAGTLGLP